jgi:phosphatidylserine synthase 2
MPRRASASASTSPSRVHQRRASAAHPPTHVPNTTRLLAKPRTQGDTSAASSSSGHDVAPNNHNDDAAATIRSPTPGAEHSSPLRPYLEERESPFGFLYKPHTATGLAVAVAQLLYFAFFAPPLDDADVFGLARRAMLCCVLCFLVYCSIQLRDSILVRPHPVVWRLVHGVGLVYLLLLVLLLVYPVAQARALLRVFDPTLGVRPPENDKLYATDCRVYTPGDAGGMFARVRECLWDVFIVAHTVGWWAKALLLRDWRLGWALSILWEVLELSFQKVLPNFHECWWDHWVIDVLLCNAAGLFLGMWTARWLELKSFDWTGREASSPTPAGPLSQLSKLAYQLRPQSFTRYEWRVVQGPTHLLAVVCLILMMETLELNAFFLKFVLYIPPASPYNVYRLVFWFALSLPATREYYAYAADASVKRMGPNMWLAITLLVAEVALVVKGAMVTPFSNNAHIPQTVAVCWSVALVAFACWAAVKFTSALRPVRNAVVLNGLLALAVGALAYLCVEQDVLLGLQVPEGTRPETISRRPSAGPFAD